MDLNIKALVGHIIDKAITRLTDYAKEDSSFAEKVAGHVGSQVDAETVAEHISYDSLAEGLNYTDLGYEIDYSELASEVDTEALVEGLADSSDLAREIGALHTAEAIALHIDYGELAAKLSPVEALGAAQAKESEAALETAVEGLSGKLLDAAVNKLLTLANAQVEQDLEAANHPDLGL